MDYIDRYMEIELAKCECCGLREDCTREYISSVKANFDEMWFCGLCSEAVRYELSRGRWPRTKEAAIKAHMSFCRKTACSNPAVGVADGMCQMLRRRRSSADSSSPRPPSASSHPSAPAPASNTFGDEIGNPISFSLEIIN